MLEKFLRLKLPGALATDANHRPWRRRHAGVRVVCFSVDLCIEHNPLLRGHLFGIEYNAEAITLLDEFRVQHGICD